MYTFTITLDAQCETMPIEYGTLAAIRSAECVPVAGCQGFGMFAQDNVGGAPLAATKATCARPCSTAIPVAPSREMIRPAKPTGRQPRRQQARSPFASITTKTQTDSKMRANPLDRLAVLHRSAGWRYSGDGDTAYR